jgi:3-methyl-2-oxobutanoate hydroxymethyltransferase
VTVDMMLHHTAAVVRAKPNALVVADIPFGVAHRPLDEALGVCVRLIQEAGAGAVKIEGGESIAHLVSALTASGIPVLGHVGLLPQQVLQVGGYRKFGKSLEESEALVRDALAIEQAGAFAIVGEMIAAKATAAITAAISVPLIGIGSGAACDGQISVLTDIIGMGLGKYPRFSKQYTDIGARITAAVAEYVTDVKSGEFPK